MRIFQRDKTQYDWIYDRIKSDVKLKPSPFLWTRIQADIEPNDVVDRKLIRLISYVMVYFRWALPLILILTVSFGILIGKELSGQYRNLLKQHQNKQVISIEKYDIHLIPEKSNENDLNPLSRKK